MISYAAEEEEQIRDRRRGEPGGKRVRVYRQTYVSPHASPQVAPLEIRSPNEAKNGEVTSSPESPEKIQVKDRVQRLVKEDGMGPSSQSDEVVRVRVQEASDHSRAIEGPYGDQPKVPTVKQGGSENENLWH